MWDSFNQSFEANLERFQVLYPHMDYEELVEKAAETTTSFFYFIEKENLPMYRNPEFWSDMA